MYSTDATLLLYFIADMKETATYCTTAQKLLIYAYLKIILNTLDLEIFKVTGFKGT